MDKWIYIKLKALAKNIACYNFALFVSPNIPLVLTNIYKFQTIAIGFYKLFKNDHKIARKPKSSHY
ncbi:hypothetical protein VN1204_10110 [Helicobacter pylori]|nr:hypothetical protein VN1204_10110 [Helicobacter pylori]